MLDGKISREDYTLTLPIDILLNVNPKNSGGS